MLSLLDLYHDLPTLLLHCVFHTNDKEQSFWFAGRLWTRLSKNHSDCKFAVLQDHVEYIAGHAVFTPEGNVKVGDNLYSGKHIMIAIGGRPTVPNFPGGLQVRLFAMDLLKPSALCQFFKGTLVPYGGNIIFITFETC